MVDVPTLLTLMAVADLILAATLWIGAARPLRDGLSAWIASLVAQALAFGLFAARSEPHSGAFALAAALLGLSLSLQAASLLAFDRRHLPAWIHSAVIAALAVPFALLGEDRFAGVLFGGLLFGTFLAALAAIAWQMDRSASRRARGIMLGSFALGAVAFYVRGIGVVFSADPAQGFVTPGAFQSATFLVGYAVILVSTFGFILLHKERADAAARRLATIDPLTGAYNRTTFHVIAERELSRARRAGQTLSIIMLDVDHFKAVNEHHGHRLGDEVLKRFADIVRAALRKEDMLVRFGGEEFLVLLPEVPGPGAVVVAGRIRREVAAQPLEIDGHRISITVSAGVAARIDEGPESADGLLARAEDALSLAKRRGRNRVVALSLGRPLAA